jgi:sulfate adenylyltransferase subunit 2
MTDHLPHLAWLEAESIYILREAAAEFSRPVLLYSIGKDSSVLLRLAKKAFAPGKIPFPLLHIDTGYKFPEMIEFRDRFCAAEGVDLLVYHSQEHVEEPVDPFRVGTQKCCALLKTKALLDALRKYGFNAAIGGARRDEEKSRAKERIYSIRDQNGQWDPRNQRPELWGLLNGRLANGQSMRIFPLSNWTESDILEYIRHEDIPVVPLYFAANRQMIVRGEALLSTSAAPPRSSANGSNGVPDQPVQVVMSRMRSLGCVYCTGAVRSGATTVQDILDELRHTRRSERQNRVIDHDEEGSMEVKKREGYF